MSVDRANLTGAGAPKVTFNAATMWTRDDVVPRLASALVEQRSSMHGRVTKTRGPRKIEIALPVFGLWESLPVLFPAGLMNPVVGSRIFTGADLPLILHARNGDRLTVHNCRVTGLANLRLAANEPIFSGTVTFTGLLKNNANPSDAASYYTYDNAAYVEGAFALTNFLAKSWTAAWGARTGFTSMATQAGWEINWEIGMDEDLVDGLGPVDMFLTNFAARASCIPVGPTVAQLESNLFFQGAGAEIGAGVHASMDDLVITSGAASVTLKYAALVETGLVYAPSKKRIGETVWETMRGFTAGVPQAVAAVA